MNRLLNASKLFVKRNGSTILTCAGGAGVVATAVLAVKATPKAMMLLEHAKEEKGEDLTKFEVIKAAAPAYIPTVLIGVSTIACIFGANTLNKYQQGSLMSAYALLDSSYKEYKSKVVDLYGEDADSRVREEIAKDKYAGDGITPDNDKVLFYDEFSGRYFQSTTVNVLKAEYEVNKKLSTWGGVYLNEFYELVGLPTTDYGDHLGWSAAGMYEMYWEEWLDFHHEKFMLDDGLEGYIITYNQEPTPGFEEY